MKSSSEIKCTVKNASLTVKLANFYFIFFLLKYQISNKAFIIIIEVIQSLQIISYSFDPRFNSIWKETIVSSYLSSFLQYFRIAPFFRHNLPYFLIGLFLSFAFLFTVTMLCLWCFLKIKNNEAKVIDNTLLKFLSLCLTLIRTVMFIPLLNVFSIMLVCGVDKDTGYSPSPFDFKYDLQCWKRYHLIYFFVSIVGLIALIGLNVNIALFSFETRIFIANNRVVNSKIEMAKIYSNAIIALLFITCCYIPINDWIIIIKLLLISCHILYLNYALIPYNNEDIMKTVISLSFILVFCNIVLLLGKCLLILLSFEGSAVLLLIGISLIVICACTGSRITIEDIDNHSSVPEFINKVRLFISSSNKEYKDRKYQFLIYRYFTNHLRNVPSYRYIPDEFPTRKQETTIILNHLVNSFKKAIAKYSTEPSLLIAFTSFQCFILNLKHQAYMSFSAFNDSQLTLNEEFIVFRNKKLLEDGNINDYNADDSLEAPEFIYSHRYSLFIKAMENSLVYYEELWNLLLKSHITKENDITKLLEIIHPLRTVIDEVDTHFQSSVRLNPFDQRLIKLYDQYLQCYQHDNTQIQQYKTKGTGMHVDKTQLSIDEMAPMSCLNNIQASSDFDFIIVSGEERSIGQILKISLKICSLCGYSQKELEGRNIDVLIPDFLKNKHRAMLIDRLFNYNIDKHTKDGNNSDQRKEMFTLLKTKAQYLLPIDMQITFLFNEGSNLIILAKVMPHLSKPQALDTLYIMTDKELKIQSFSLDTMSHFHLSSNMINSEQEITYCIKELYEIYFNEVTGNPHLDKRKIKHKIIEHHYSAFKDITWKNKARKGIEAYSYSKHAHETDSEYNSLVSSNAQYAKMKVKPIRMNGKEGYIFIFKPNSSIISSTSISNNCNQLPMSFIPQGIKISYDPNKKAFLLFTQPDQGIEKYAQEKIKELVATENKNESSGSSSYSDQSSSSANDNANDNATSDSQEKDSSLNATPNKELLQPNRLNNNEDVYFKVNISKIRLSIYDFNKKMLCDCQQNKCDKIEDLMKTEGLIENSDDSLYIKKYSHNRNSIKLTINSNDSDSPAIINNKTSKIKSSSLIVRYSIVLSIIFLIMVLVSVIYFSSLFSSAIELENIGLYFNNHFYLEINTVYSSFYSTELALLNNEKYSNYYNSTGDYRASCISILLSIYNSTHERLNRLLQYESLLPTFIKRKLNEQYVPLKIVNTKAEIVKYTVNLFSSILEVNTASYRLTLAPIQNQTLSNVDYSLISLNGETVNLNALFNTLTFSFEQLQKVVTDDIIFIWVYYILFLLMGCAFSIWSYFEIRIIRIKLIEYLKIYFIIDDKLIQRALVESKKFHESYIESKYSVLHSNDMSLNGNQDSIDSLSNAKETNVIEDDNNKNQALQANESTKRRINYYPTLIAHSMQYILVIAIITFNTIAYFTILGEIPQIVNLTYQQSILELNFLGIYNHLRAYIIYCTIQNNQETIYEANLKENILTAYTFLETTLNKSIGSVTKQKILDKQTKGLLDSIYFQSLCPLFEKSIHILPNQEPLKCEHLANNVTSFGLNIILVHYIELIRHLAMITDNAKEVALASGYVYNELLHGTDKYNEIVPADPDEYIEYQAKNPFFLLSGSISREITVLWKYVIQPSFQLIRIVLYDLFVNTIKRVKLYATISFALFYAIFLLYYFFYHLPTIKSITADLHKTQRLISIIPYDILETCYIK